MIPKRVLNTLIVCFWINILFLTTMFVYSVTTLFLAGNGIVIESNPIVTGLITLFYLPVLFLFVYAVYFFYKYDKYSKSGLYLFFFHILYAHIYFYNVMWKRKRDLVNSFENEQVLGNKIFIETEELEDFESDTETPINQK